MSITNQAADALLDHALAREHAAHDLFVLVTELVDDVRHGRIDNESLDTVQFVAEQLIEEASSASVGVAN